MSTSESFHMDQSILDTTGISSNDCTGDDESETLLTLVHASIQPEMAVSSQCPSTDQVPSMYTHNLNTLTNVALSLQDSTDNDLSNNHLPPDDDEASILRQELLRFETLTPVCIKEDENEQLTAEPIAPSAEEEGVLLKNSSDIEDSEEPSLPMKKQSNSNKANWKGHTNRFTIQQRVYVLQLYWRHQRDYKSIKEAFMRRFNGAEPPTRSSIRNLNSKFEKEGTVIDRARSGRPTSVTSEQKIEEVRQYLSTNKKSTRVACKELKISKTSLLRIMKKVGSKTSTDHDYAKWKIDRLSNYVLPTATVFLHQLTSYKSFYNTQV